MPSNSCSGPNLPDLCHCCRLRCLFLMTAASSIPRPLIAHWPRDPFEQPDPYGQAFSNNLVCHYVQPNTIEFEPALQWRHHTAVIEYSKDLGRSETEEAIKKIMREFVEVR